MCIRDRIHQGGPVILMQVENEYGYYGDDTRYMETMKQLMLDNGAEVPLVTSDGPMDESLSCGRLSGVLPTGNFGSKTEERFEVLKKYTEGGPLTVSYTHLDVYKRQEHFRQTCLFYEFPYGSGLSRLLMPLIQKRCV